MITTPDRRLRVFVSSTLKELAEERDAARRAIEQLRLTPIMFEAGARDHGPADVYHSYLEQSDVFLGIYWQSGGWARDASQPTGLEDEFQAWTSGPRLLYIKEPAPNRDSRLAEFLADIAKAEESSYRRFATADELFSLVAQDLAMVVSERFLDRREGLKLPRGTVTFLFTDIEGSTVLLRSLGEQYADLLRSHNELIREAISVNRGTEVDTAGDGFFVVFPSAVDAINAAVESQRALAQHRWPQGAIVRVRMGVHTGEGTPVGDRYVGIDVHRAARIAAAGHGGQVLVSSTTARLIADMADLSLVDLGQHRLKDLPSNETIYQVAAHGLDSRFPALRSIDASRTNLLDKASSFVGREDEIGSVKELLKNNRLVTLTGPGGTGKTRLAIQIGKRAIANFHDGVWLVPLGAVGKDDEISQACLNALGLREQPGRGLEETLTDYFGGGTSLIIVDNCEHVLTGASQLVAKIVERCPNVSLLATSREPLRVPGEQVFLVPPLGLPPRVASSVAELEGFDSVRLFVERAAAARGGFSLDMDSAEDVARLVNRLDGVPLALELAAARASSMSPGQIADRLEKSFDLLRDRGGTSEDRHRTMAAVVDWSHGLLPPEDQKIFRRLSVFRGGFDLDAAESMVADAEVPADSVVDDISALVDRSLVVAERGTGGFRYRMLEVIRQYSSARLTDAGEDSEFRDRHARWFLKQVGPALWPLNPNPGWYTARMTDHPNLEAAHDWLISRRDAASAITMAVALGWFWYNEGYWAEGRTRAAQALALYDGARPLTALRCQALVVSALLAFRQGDYVESLRLAREAETLAGVDFPGLTASSRSAQALALVAAEALNEATGLADSVLAYARSAESSWFVGAVLITVGRVALARGDLSQAASLHAEATGVMQANDDPWALASAWEGLGAAHLFGGEVAAAAHAFEMSLSSNPIAYDKASISTALLGACRLGGPDDGAALRLIHEGSSVIFRRRDWVGRAYLLSGVLPALLRHKHQDVARSLIETDLAIARSTDDLRGRCRSLAAAASLHTRLGEHDRSTALALELLAIRVGLAEDRQILGALRVAAGVLLEGGYAQQAAHIWATGERTLGDLGPLPVEQAQSQNLRAQLESILGKELLVQAEAAAQSMSLEEAVRLAEASLTGLV